MNKKLLSFLVFFILLIIGASCKKTKTNVIYNAEYPNNIGTTWKYKVYDSILNFVDTITISVIGIAQHDNGKSVKIWKIESFYLRTIDTNFVCSGIEGIDIYQNKLFTAPVLKHYEFPLTVGKNWVNGNLSDISKVIESNTQNIIAGTFNDCFTINRSFQTFPGYNITKENDFFVNNIGLIKRSHFEISLGTFINKTWELLTYSIK